MEKQQLFYSINNLSMVWCTFEVFQRAAPVFFITISPSFENKKVVGKELLSRIAGDFPA